MAGDKTWQESRTIMAGGALSHWVGRIHRCSGFAVYASIALLAEALWYAWRGLPPYHAVAMASLVLPVFVAGIASSYAASGIRRSSVPGAVYAILVAATCLLALAGLATGVAVLRGSMPSRPLMTALYGLYALALWLAALKAPRGSVRLSIAGLAYAFSLATAYTTAPPGQGFYEEYLGLVYAVAVTSIYAVSIHSIPSTYGERPRLGLVYVLYALQGLGLLLYKWRPWIGSAALSVTMALYMPAARLDRLPAYLAKARSMRRGPARSSHLYFLVGHVFVVAYILMVIAASVMYSGDPSSQLLLYIYIHVTSIGFVAQHILIHAPMMVPIILGIPTARRYTALNYIALFLATISFPLSRDAALALLVAALATTVLIVWPRRGPTGIPPSL